MAYHEFYVILFFYLAIFWWKISTIFEDKIFNFGITFSLFAMLRDGNILTSLSRKAEISIFGGSPLAHRTAPWTWMLNYFWFLGLCSQGWRRSPTTPGLPTSSAAGGERDHLLGILVSGSGHQLELVGISWISWMTKSIFLLFQICHKITFTNLQIQIKISL